MQNHKLFDLIILGTWLFIAIIITIDYNIKTVPIKLNQVLQTNSEVEVEKLSLVGENSIDITLKDKNKSRVILFFPLRSNKDKISDAISHSSDQKVVFKENGKKIDLKFFFKGKEISINECIEEKP